MSNYIEYDNQIAFHPGYYIAEHIKWSNAKLKEYAKHLGTTPEGIRKLIDGQARLSQNMASKLSELTETSVEYWINLQHRYDNLLREFQMEKDSELHLNADKNA